MLIARSEWSIPLDLSIRRRGQLEALLSSGLNREATHGQESRNDKRPRSVNWCVRIHSPRMYCDNGRAKTRDSVEE